MSKVKRQHYVPRFLLAGFAGEDGKLSVFGRERGCWFRAEPENVAVQRYYHAERTEAGEIDTQRIENELSQIEGDGSSVVRDLLSGKKPTADQRNAFALFLTSQDFRSPRKRQDYADMLLGIEHHKLEKNTVRSVEDYTRVIKQASDVTKPFDASALSNGSELTVDENGIVSVGFEATIRALQAAKHFAPIVAEMDWRLLRAPSGTGYVIGDSPVQLYEEPSTLEMHTGPGYWRPGSNIAMPLTSEVCFVASHSLPHRERIWRPGFTAAEAKGSEIRFLNQLQLDGCYNQVYATADFPWLAKKTAALPAAPNRLSFMPVGADGNAVSVETKRT
jgi:hypothetical protein